MHSFRSFLIGAHARRGASECRVTTPSEPFIFTNILGEHCAVRAFALRAERIRCAICPIKGHDLYMSVYVYIELREPVAP